MVYIIYTLMFSCGLLAMLLRGLPDTVQFYTGVAYATLIFGTVYALQYRKFLIPSNWMREYK